MLNICDLQMNAQFGNEWFGFYLGKKYPNVIEDFEKRFDEESPASWKIIEHNGRKYVCNLVDYDNISEERKFKLAWVWLFSCREMAKYPEDYSLLPQEIPEQQPQSQQQQLLQQSHPEEPHPENYFIGDNENH